jgi:HPt (histidine-containing phosphotransfer) domain-containing protein
MIRRSEALAELPVVALTAGAMPAQELSAQEAGMNAFVSKPFEVGEIVAVIRSLTAPDDAGSPTRALAPSAGAEPEPERATAARNAGAPAAALSGAESSAAADLPGLAIGQALALWKDPEVYRRYLRKLAAEHGDTAARLAVAEPEQARRVAHRLKGAAGNLGLLEVAARCAEIERLAAAEADDDALAAATTALAVAFETALASIARYAPEPVAEVAPETKTEPGGAPRAAATGALEQTRAAESADREMAAAAAPADGAIAAHAGERSAIAPLLQEAFRAFADFDPIGAEPAVAQLAHHLPPVELAALTQAVADLSASDGLEALRALAETLGIELEERP